MASGRGRRRRSVRTAMVRIRATDPELVRVERNIHELRGIVRVSTTPSGGQRVRLGYGRQKT